MANYCSSCDNGCSGNCSGRCVNSCSGSCVGNCTGTCNGQCSGYCVTGCVENCSWACHGKCRETCGENCDAYCWSGCRGSCSVYCRSTCSGGCSTTCSGGCSKSCSDNCTNSCGGTCRSTCSNTCGQGCSSTCGGGCTATCSDTCDASNCRSGCTGGCKDSCDTQCVGCFQTCDAACAGSVSSYIYGVLVESNRDDGTYNEQPIPEAWKDWIGETSGKTQTWKTEGGQGKAVRARQFELAMRWLLYEYNRLQGSSTEKGLPIIEHTIDSYQDGMTAAKAQEMIKYISAKGIINEMNSNKENTYTLFADDKKTKIKADIMNIAVNLATELYQKTYNR